MDHIIVRRGRFLIYEKLRRTFGDNPQIDIMWDRRRPTDMLPVASDAPVERRGRIPLEWGGLDYLFTSGKHPNESGEPPTS